VAVGSPKELVEMFDRQLRDAETDLCRAVRDPKTGRYLTVPLGTPPINMIASCAAAMARDLILESGQRLSWTRWNRLSALLFEAATDKYDMDLSRHVKACKKGQIIRSRPAGGYFRW
jgi:hypothetical protein